MELIHAEEVKMFLASLNIEKTDWSSIIYRRVRDSGAEDKGVEVHSGVTKICLTFRDLPYVVKWTTVEDTSDGYSEAMREVELYNQAKALKLERMLPETVHFAKINGVDFVAQARIDCTAYNPNYQTLSAIRKGTKTIKHELLDKISDNMNKGQIHTRNIDHAWLGMIVSLYGKRFARRLARFIVANHIDDLHRDNIGYKDCKPVILDFSGYNRH